MASSTVYTFNCAILGDFVKIESTLGLCLSNVEVYQLSTDTANPIFTLNCPFSGDFIKLKSVN